MKLQDWVNRKRVLILINIGASHNFVSIDLDVELGLKVDATPPYNVCLGDGHKKITSGCCRTIMVQLEEHVVEKMFYLFEVGGVGLILGVTWLASLRDVKVNWNTLTMSFNVNGQLVQIKGDW